MKRRIGLILLLMLIASVSHSQTSLEGNRIIRSRTKMIDFYHVSLGLDISSGKNLYAVPRASLGIGTFRNLLNADIGLKYKLGNPFFFDDEEHLVPQHLIAFASLKLNLFSWKSNCIFLCGEMACNIPTVTLHYLPTSNIIEYDKEIGKKHFSVLIKAGISLDRWSIELFYEYDLAPALNQKYVYESLNFDYDSLRDILFERNRIGVSVAYHLPFNL